MEWGDREQEFTSENGGPLPSFSTFLRPISEHEQTEV